MGRSPLDHPRLAIIDRKLDSGELEEAQHLLAQLGDNYFFRHATTYLASRLLYLRGTLDADSLIERLSRVLNETHDFPEAETLLARAKSGSLERVSAPPQSSRPPPASLSSPPPGAEVELAFGGRVGPEDRQRLIAPEFPRAGRVPSLEPARAPGSIPDLEVPTSTPSPGFAAAKPAAPAGDIELTERARRIEARYSSSNELSETIALTRKSTRPSTRPVARSHTEPMIGHDAPPHHAPQASLFEIAALLDAGRASAALEALDARTDHDEPDHALLRARALARAHRTTESSALARRLGQAPLLEPTLRAGVARLALELGDVDFALEQAELAHDDDPTQPTVCLTYAWAALRRARRAADPKLVSRASLALRELVGDGGPHEGLLLGLRACVEAHAGDAVRALRLAERSLALEPNADGNAALAMAAARLGRFDDVKRASAWLQENFHDEAVALKKSLDEHGERLFELRAQPDSIHAPATSAAMEASALWGPLEHAVVEGRWSRAWETFAQLADDTFSQVSSAARHEPPALAAVAASFLTIAPISRDLAPYDQTPWSLARLADLLALLARGAAGVRPEHALGLLVGAYVGESVRLAVGGHWQGPTAEAAAREVVSPRGIWRPCEIVASALAGTSDLAAVATLAETEVAGHRAAPHLPAVTPLCPWDPAEWPAPSRLPHYAKAVEQSVISVLCAERSGTALDGSLASLHALDEHVDRIAPRAAPAEPDARWARRATVLVGAYLGEVVRRETTAEWSKRDSVELGPSSYRLVLPTGRELRPVEHVFTRLSARATGLHEYALRWVRRGQP
ncbi:MAG: hypothetical protein IT377_20760 [Polyangiaceae bacterium]|nr:hypothetical protein [Polyangiaceae bacterium]